MITAVSHARVRLTVNGDFPHILFTCSSKVRMHIGAHRATVKEPKSYFIYFMPDPVGLVLLELSYTVTIGNQGVS